MLLHGTVLPSEADAIAQYETKLEGITKGIKQGSPSKLITVPKVWPFL